MTIFEKLKIIDNLLTIYLIDQIFLNDLSAIFKKSIIGTDQ